MASKPKRGIKGGQTQSVAVFNGTCCTFDQYVAAQEGGFGHDRDRTDVCAHQRRVVWVDADGGCGVIFSDKLRCGLRALGNLLGRDLRLPDDLADKMGNGLGNVEPEFFRRLGTKLRNRLTDAVRRGRILAKAGFGFGLTICKATCIVVLQRR